MDEHTVSILLDLNRQFYQTFGPAFAATRRRIQPGVRRVLDSLPAGGQWLDLGCGGGALGLAWAQHAAEHGAEGTYTGLDFSASLLEEAAAWVHTHAPGAPVSYHPADLGNPDWQNVVEGRQFDVITCFAALHHIPGEAARLDILRVVRGLLAPLGVFIHSEWQFQHSPKLMERVQPWSLAGLREDQVDPGDTLLDWRYALPGQVEQRGLRYVHLYSREELARLAAQCGFCIKEEFESDGAGGRLSLYQTWMGENGEKQAYGSGAITPPPV